MQKLSVELTCDWDSVKRSALKASQLRLIKNWFTLLHIERAGKSTKNLMASYLHNNGKGQEFYQLFVERAGLQDNFSADILPAWDQVFR